MKGYKGKIVFYKNERGYTGVNFDCEWLRDSFESYEYVFLAETEVDVAFEDSRLKEIEAIKKRIALANAEHQMNINRMLGKIQELQALENDGE